MHLIQAVRRGDLGLPEVLSAHGISPEEWVDWNYRFKRFGAAGLTNRAGDAVRRLTAPRVRF